MNNNIYHFTAIELRVAIMKALKMGFTTIQEIDNWIEKGMTFNGDQFCLKNELPNKSELIYGSVIKKNSSNKIKFSKVLLRKGIYVETYSNDLNFQIRVNELLNENKTILYQGNFDEIESINDLLEFTTISDTQYYKNYEYPKNNVQWFIDSKKSLWSACRYKLIIIYRQ